MFENTIDIARFIRASLRKGVDPKHWDPNNCTEILKQVYKSANNAKSVGDLTPNRLRELCCYEGAHIAVAMGDYKEAASWHRRSKVFMKSGSLQASIAAYSVAWCEYWGAIIDDSVQPVVKEALYDSLVAEATALQTIAKREGNLRWQLNPIFKMALADMLTWREGSDLYHHLLTDSIRLKLSLYLTEVNSLLQGQGDLQREFAAPLAMLELASRDWDVRDWLVEIPNHGGIEARCMAKLIQQQQIFFESGDGLEATEAIQDILEESFLAHGGHTVVFAALNTLTTITGITSR